MNTTTETTVPYACEHGFMSLSDAPQYGMGCPVCKEAKKKADAEANRLKLQAEWNEKKAKETERNDAIRQAVRREVIAAGHTCDIKTDKNGIVEIYVDGVDVSWEFKIDEIYSRHSRSWRNSAPKLVIVTGRWKAKSRHPQLKAGGFKYAKVAADLIRLADIRKMEEDQDKVRIKNRAIVAAFEKDHKVPFCLYLDASTNASKPFDARIRYSESLTEAQVLKLIEVLNGTTPPDETL